MMCNGQNCLFQYITKVAVNLELHAFYPLPLAFLALTAGPASTMATPSTLFFTCPSPDTGLPAVSTTLL